jgi:hypothetical protein
MQIDHEYQERVRTALLEAVVKASMNETGDASMMKSGEVCFAALDLIALLAAGSDETSSPVKRREFSIKMGKRLLGKLVTIQAEFAENGWPANLMNVNARDVN